MTLWNDFGNLYVKCNLVLWNICSPVCTCYGCNILNCLRFWRADHKEKNPQISPLLHLLLPPHVVFCCPGQAEKRKIRYSGQKQITQIKGEDRKEVNLNSAFHSQTTQKMRWKLRPEKLWKKTDLPSPQCIKCKHKLPL